ncbi:MAG: hypothetical protein ACR2HN_08880 [Tepidiformaceae bacterium]
MKAVAVVVVLVFAALAQVTVASLFPWRGALPDLALMALVLFAAFRGPVPVMAGLPILALSLGFVSGRAPSLLLLAYLPLLPLAYALEEAAVPLNRYVRLLIAGCGTGAWARLVLALGVIAQGAPFDFSVLITDLIVPGLFLDAALLTVSYLPLRAVGCEPQGLALRGGRY